MTHATARNAFKNSISTFDSFNSIEREKDELNINEFFSAVQNVGATNLTREEVEALFITIDMNKDERLSKAEFEQAMVWGLNF